MSGDMMLYAELVLLMVVIGAVGGFLSGLLGVGGGIVFVPALFFTLQTLHIAPEHIMHIAVGTSLALVLATSISSGFLHHKKQSVDMTIAKTWAPWIVFGVIIGTIFAAHADGNTLKEIFAVVLGLIALYMGTGKEKVEVTVPSQGWKAYMFYPACFVIGILSAMIGIGGAIMTIPMMVYRGLPMQRAVGTGAVLGLAVAFPGTIGYIISGWKLIPELPAYSLGYINLVAFLIILPVSLLVVKAGVKAAHILPRKTLRRIFAVVLLVISLRMFLTA